MNWFGYHRIFVLSIIIEHAVRVNKPDFIKQTEVLRYARRINNKYGA